MVLVDANPIGNQLSEYLCSGGRIQEEDMLRTIILFSDHLKLFAGAWTHHPTRARYKVLASNLFAQQDAVLVMAVPLNYHSASPLLSIVGSNALT